VAKKQMKCVFSRRQCKNCSLYIGRHYYLCYQGNQTNGKIKKDLPVGTRSGDNFEVPQLKLKVFDPFNSTI
jgi:hypothetical protein